MGQASDKARSDSFPLPSRVRLSQVFMVFTLLTLGFWLVNVSSAASEMTRDGNPDAWLQATILETSSTLVIIALFWGVAGLDFFAPISRKNWRTQILFYAVLSLVYSVVHVFSMSVIRFLLWPIFFKEAYFTFDQPLEDFLYEYRKDAWSFILTLLTLHMARHLHELTISAQASLKAARKDHMLTLRSGGRELRLPISNFLYAKAAGNYVEVVTVQGGTHLVRLTLSELESLLEEGEGEPCRLHRSYLTRKSLVREITPLGDGRAEAHLVDGQILPVGRAYRASV